MSKHLLLCCIIAVFAFGCASVPVKPLTPAEAQSRENIKKCYDFIKEVGYYYIATVDEDDQARVRPFGTIHIFEDRLYIQTGRSKNVGRQLLKNGKIEICVRKGDEWIRLSGEVVEDPRSEAKASLLKEYPELRKIGYSEEDRNTMVLYFKPGTAVATFNSFKHAPVVVTF